jgi:trans-aconitate methyltransferase
MLSPQDQNLAKCNFLNDNFLHYCRDKTVVELGCFDGHITEWIVKNNPSKLTLLEASETPVNQVRKKFPEAIVIHGDMHEDLNKVGKVDVALVLGVIYHSHAPLHVLEKLVNCCDPTTIIIDNMAPGFEWYNEVSNRPGMRYVVGNKKTCNIVITISNELTVQVMTNLGYQLIKKDVYPLNSRGPGQPIFHFKKI